jgi:hypothetical protein
MKAMEKAKVRSLKQRSHEASLIGAITQSPNKLCELVLAKSVEENVSFLSNGISYALRVKSNSCNIGYIFPAVCQDGKRPVAFLT